MTPDRWVRVKEVLASALERREEHRDAFLDEACGSDQELRREVESLLTAERSSTLESPAAEILGGEKHQASVAPEIVAGQMLGHYRIDSKLGEGGMGTVYKARDPHLDRFVAIKVLPPEKVADPDRKRRFIQEAKAASALNHPNIITIHDIAMEDGVDFMVMEYLPGKTLDQVIPRKGLRLDQALKYAVEIAGALAAAHTAGIVHRDVKPANIMVTDQGRVKVVDFGLAKLTERTASGEAETGRSAPPMTGEGTILGTADYMSPEQAQGQAVDARSDIFSFGSVLYEMVSGRRAFPGKTPMAAMAAILTQEPAPLGAEFPHDLDKLIRHCLRKDPERRLQHMDDVRSLLEALKEEPESGGPAATARAAPRRHRKLIWSLGLVGVLGLATVMFWLLRPHPQAPQPSVAPLTTYPGSEGCPSFSPDCSQVAFAWNGEKQENFDIYIQVIGSGRPLRLTTHPALEWSPAWSPDGRYIAFWRFVDGMASIVLISPLPGGAERVLDEVDAQGVLRPIGTLLAWTADSRWLAFTGGSSADEGWGITLLSLQTGEKRRLTSPPKSALDCHPALSPDGRGLVFARMASLVAYGSELYWLDLTGDLRAKGEPKRITFENRLTMTPAWTADGREVIYSSGGTQSRSLWRKAAPSLGTGLRNPARPERLSFPGENVDSPAVSGLRRRLIYVQNVTDSNIWQADLTGALHVSGRRRLIASTRAEWVPQFSPGGERIAFISGRSGRNEVWVCDRDGFGAEQLTNMNAPITGCPRWSPDGERIVFDSNAEGQYEVYIISAKGGRPLRLTSDPADDALPSWSRDGRWIYFGSDRTGRWEVWKMPAAGGPAVQFT